MKEIDQNNLDTAIALGDAVCEELGICSEIEIIGNLSMFYIPPSHFNVYPSVGMLDKKPQFNPNPNEVAEVFGFPLRSLLDPAIKSVEEHVFNGRNVRVPFYQVNGHKVWGATAIMLSELESRLQVIL